MGLFIAQDEKRSELQSKVIAELRQKTKQSALDEGRAEHEPRYLENQHETRPAGVVIGLLLMVLLISVAVYVSNR